MTRSAEFFRCPFSKMRYAHDGAICLSCEIDNRLQATAHIVRLVHIACYRCDDWIDDEKRYSANLLLRLRLGSDLSFFFSIVFFIS